MMNTEGPNDLSIFPIVAMIFFLGAFAAVLMQLAWATRDADADRASRLPLEDGETRHGEQ